jgi:hypothetical protein
VLGVRPVREWQLPGWPLWCKRTIAPFRLVRAQERKCTVAPLVLISYLVGMVEAADTDPVIRKTVSLPTSVWRRIEDFQFENRVKRDAEAIRRLIELGLEAAKKKQLPKGKRSA